MVHDAFYFCLPSPHLPPARWVLTNGPNIAQISDAFMHRLSAAVSDGSIWREANLNALLWVMKESDQWQLLADKISELTKPDERFIEYVSKLTSDGRVSTVNRTSQFSFLPGRELAAFFDHVGGEERLRRLSSSDDSDIAEHAQQLVDLLEQSPDRHIAPARS